MLAPMADVTDASFRRVISTYGKPDVMWTEFVSADGIVRATEEGKKKLMRDLLYSDKAPSNERPIVAQLFGSHPEYMREAAQIVAHLGFDGIDINMGCPDKSIEKQGCGAAMMKDPLRAREIIRAAREGGVRVEERDGRRVEIHLPISVKTRIGYNKDELDTWLPELLKEEPAVITIHARTRKEMSKVPARWEHVAHAVQIRDEVQRAAISSGQPHTLIFGNGDILNLEDARQKAEMTGADGVMLGRAIFGNPWLFKPLSAGHSEIPHVAYQPQVEERLAVMVEHTLAFEELLGDVKNFSIMKKHYKAYVNGFDGAKELRMELMEASNATEVEHLVEQFLANRER